MWTPDTQLYGTARHTCFAPPKPAYAEIGEDFKRELSTIFNRSVEGADDILSNIVYGDSTAARGIFSCTVAAPTYLLELPAEMFSSVAEHSLGVDFNYESRSANKLKRTNQAELFFDKQCDNIHKRLRDGVFQRSFANILAAPLTIISRITTIAETIFKGLINVLGSPFSGKCNLKTGAKQLFCNLPHRLLSLPANIYFCSMQILYAASGHVSTWDSNRRLI